MLHPPQNDLMTDVYLGHCQLFLQKAPPQIFGNILNTPQKCVIKNMTQQNIPACWTKQTNIADRNITETESILEVHLLS